MKRAVDIGPVDAAAIKTVGGKVRLRLLFTVDQLAALLEAAAEDGSDDEGTDDPVKRSVTQCNAPESEKRRSEEEGGGDARAAPAESGPSQRIFVIEGTKAWNAWMDRKLKETNRKWTLTTTQNVDGKVRTGWYFLSLFPPPE